MWNSIGKIFFILFLMLNLISLPAHAQMADERGQEPSVEVNYDVLQRLKGFIENQRKAQEEAEKTAKRAALAASHVSHSYKPAPYKKQTRHAVRSHHIVKKHARAKVSKPAEEKTAVLQSTEKVAGTNDNLFTAEEEKPETAPEVKKEEAPVPIPENKDLSTPPEMKAGIVNPVENKPVTPIVTPKNPPVILPVQPEPVQQPTPAPAVTPVPAQEELKSQPPVTPVPVQEESKPQPQAQQPESPNMPVEIVPKQAESTPKPQEAAPVQNSQPVQEKSQPKAKEQGSVILKIEYDAKQTEIPKSYIGGLDRIVSDMRANYGRRITIVSYASKTDGQASTARRISLSRALAVRKYIIDKGIENTRINVQAMGDNTSESPADRLDILAN